MFTFDDLVTKEFILNRVREEEIFERYLSITIRTDEKYVNTLPGRPKLDRRPGCSFFERSDNRLIFKDWGWRSFDCFEAAKQYYGYSWQQTLQQIARDFGLITATGSTPIIYRDAQLPPRSFRSKDSYVSIQVKVKPWKPKEIAFWQFSDRSVTIEELEKLRVFTISHYWFDGWLSGQDLSGAFGYYLGYPDKWQIYRPFVKNKRYKFRQSSSSWVIGLTGLDRTCGYVVVTKSYKDYVTLQLLGYNACCVLSESHVFTQEQVEILDTYSNVFLLYDNDEIGKTFAQQRAEEHSWYYILYPEALGKDTYAIAKEHGTTTVKDFLDEQLDAYLHG